MSTTAIARPTGAPANETALTAATGSVEIEQATLVSRRFGNAATDAPPLLFLQHFLGDLDNWDPALVDRVAGDREVILLGDRGSAPRPGMCPTNVEDMAGDVLRFVDAIGLRRSHVLGFVANSDNDTTTIRLLAPRLQLRIHSDSGHGFLDPYPEPFGDHVRAFLNGG